MKVWLCRLALPLLMGDRLRLLVCWLMGQLGGELRVNRESVGTNSHSFVALKWWEAATRARPLDLPVECKLSELP
jgi:hypothetical protein